MLDDLAQMILPGTTPVDLPIRQKLKISNLLLLMPLPIFVNGRVLKESHVVNLWFIVLDSLFVAPLFEMERLVSDQSRREESGEVQGGHFADSQ